MMSTVHVPSTVDDKATKIWTTFRKAAIQTLKPVSFAVYHPALLIIVSSSGHGLVREPHCLKNTPNYVL